MPSFKVTTNINKIQLSDKWIDSAKFNSKNRIVDENGKPASSTYKGRRYQLISKKERTFSHGERFGRGLLGIAAIIFSLGIGLLFKSIRDLLTKKQEKIRFGVIYYPSNLKENTPIFPMDKVQEACRLWMTTFLKDFKPSEIKTYTIDQLYQDDVDDSEKEVEAMQAVYKTLWGDKKKWWTGKLPENWTKHSGSSRSWNIESSNFPQYIYKFCSTTPERGIPAAHFLRVPKGKEIKSIVEEKKLDELEIVEERLIALKPKDEIQSKSEREQCYHFVVKSNKINLLNYAETVSTLASYDQQKQIKIATQIMQLICQSGLGDVGFHNFNINKETGKVVVLDTEPLFGSMLLDEKAQSPNQYQKNDQLKRTYSNTKAVIQGLSTMVEASSELPTFKKVAEIYKAHFLESNIKK